MKFVKILSILSKKDFENAQKNNQVPVIMPKGHIELHPNDMILTDKTNCFICNSDFYHTSLKCSCLKYEMESGEPVRCIAIKDAKARKMTYCSDCSRQDYLMRHGRLDEME